MKDFIDNLVDLDGAKILEYLTLTPDQGRTGNTEHFIGGKEQEEFQGLAICQYTDEKGVYLFYCDSEWNVLTDTWHDNIEDAKNQASFEYENLAGNWRKKINKTPHNKT